VEIAASGAGSTVSVDGAQQTSRADSGTLLPHGGVTYESLDDPPGSGSGASYIYIDDVEVILSEP